MTTFLQELAHRTNVAQAEGAKQTAMAIAKAAYDGTPAAWPAYAAAVKNADAAFMRAIISSAEANGHAVDGRQALYWLTGSLV
jgi:hypothetical protein